MLGAVSAAWFAVGILVSGCQSAPRSPEGAQREAAVKPRAGKSLSRICGTRAVQAQRVRRELQRRALKGASTPLARALVRSTWTWRSDEQPEPVDTHFMGNGTVHHVGMRGVWRQTGADSVSIETSDGDRLELTFDKARTSFRGDRLGVHGEVKPHA